VNTSILYLTTSSPFGDLSTTDIKLILTTDTGATPAAGETISIESVNINTNQLEQYIIAVSGV
jgi:hypothetical protein